MMNTAIVTCNCATCNGLSARVKGDGTTAGGRKIRATAIHNLVRMAHSPLAKSASTQASGPWAI